MEIPEIASKVVSVLASAEEAPRTVTLSAPEKSQKKFAMTFNIGDMQLRALCAADYLDTPEAQAEHLAAALETSDPSYIRKAIKTVACARGIAGTEDSVDANYQGFHTALSEDCDPRLSTLLAILQSPGVRIRIQVANQASE